jgi:hypothetical protein
MRWYFYDKVFKFNESNLSFFPAQAGEMGLVADITNKSIELKIVSEKASGQNKLHIGLNEEMDLFREYYKVTKGIEISYSTSSDTKLWGELIKTGYSPEDFQKKIFDCLIKDIVSKGSAPKVENTIDQKRGKLAAAAAARVSGQQQPPAVAVAGNTVDTMMSLEELFMELFNDNDTLLKNAISLYINIATKVIPELLKIPEDKFPVNMTKQEVETEWILIDLHNKAITEKKNSMLMLSELNDNAYAKSQFKQRSSYKNNGTYNNSNTVNAQSKVITLKHSNFDKQLDYALWEDLGIDSSYSMLNPTATNKNTYYKTPIPGAEIKSNNLNNFYFGIVFLQKDLEFSDRYLNKDMEESIDNRQGQQPQILIHATTPTGNGIGDTINQPTI